MRLKQKPEDFSVKESYRFDADPEGRFFVYLMDKQKLSTFEAIERIRQRFNLRPGAISFCGLKDKQGRTEQLIAVDSAEVDSQDPDLRLKPLGRTARALSAANTNSNRFSVTVRALEQGELGSLPLAAAEVNRLGVVNYFDSQRFGSLKHGQGFIAKDLFRGDFQAALKNHLAKPSPLDRTEDAKVKSFWRANWGQWDLWPHFAGAKKYERIIHSLRKHPEDYAKAFLQIDADYRALLLFTYQSYLWNEGVRRLLQILLPRESLFPQVYQAGTVLFHRDSDADTLRFLREHTFPLLSPQTTFTDPKIEEAARWAMGKEKLTLDQLAVPEVGKMLYLKHEERPILVYPQKLVLGRSQKDEINRGFFKLNVAFTLPPGSYATLVVKRLFHFSKEVDGYRDIRDDQENAKLAEAESRKSAGETAPRSFRPERGAPEERAPSSRSPAGPRSAENPRGEGRPQGARSFAPRNGPPGRDETRSARPYTPRDAGRSARPYTPRDRPPAGRSEERGARPFSPRGGTRDGARSERPYSPRSGPREDAPSDRRPASRNGARTYGAIEAGGSGDRRPPRREGGPRTDTGNRRPPSRGGSGPRSFGSGDRRPPRNGAARPPRGGAAPRSFQRDDRGPPRDAAPRSFKPDDRRPPRRDGAGPRHPGAASAPRSFGDRRQGAGRPSAPPRGRGRRP